MKTTFSVVGQPKPPVRCVVELEPEDIEEILSAYTVNIYGAKHPVSRVLAELVVRLRRECQ